MKAKMKYMLLVLGIWNYFANGNANQDVKIANNYVDAVLENFRKDAEISKYLSELSLPDYIKKDFAVKNLLVKGLLNLYRNENCSISHKKDTFDVVANVALRDVFITMDYTANVMFFSINGVCVVSVDHLSMRLDFSNKNGQVTLNSFKVINLGDYRVKKITGMSFVLNWLLKLMTNVAAQSAKQNIIIALEKEAGKALGDLVKKQKLPIY